MPQLISTKEAHVTYGGEPVFDNITFSIEDNDKICLVGRNGCGKSTLLKLLAGEIQSDGGEIFIKPGIRIGYLPQKINYDPNHSIYEYLLSAIKKDENIDYTFQADIILHHFDLTGDLKLSTLSGGQLRRAALARALIDQCDLLLLDEPTNHLDIGAIEWLEDFLKSYKGALVCISHDRTFLSNVTAKTFWMRRGQIMVNPKGYSDFERWSEAIEEQELNTLVRLGKKLDQENQWLQGGVTARRKRNIKRLWALKDLREDLRKQKTKYIYSKSTIKLPPMQESDANRLVVEVDNISKSFDKKKIISNFSTRIMRGDKIGIIGRNGSGKSTFLKIITSRLTQDHGRLKFGRTQTKFADELSYFDQDRSQLNLKKTPWEIMCPTGGDQVKIKEGTKHVVGYLRDFMFTHEQVKTKVAALSGGQASRLLLAKVLAQPGNVLVMDEPTNDLDMETLDMLQEILCDYAGTLIIVSHDRDFLDRIVARTIVFEGDGIVEEYVGGYSDYLEQKNASKPSNKKSTTQAPIVLEKSEKLRSDKITKLSYKQKLALEKLPGEIEQLQTALKDLETQLSNQDLYKNNQELFYQITKEFTQKKHSLEQKENNWLEIELLRQELEE